MDTQDQQKRSLTLVPQSEEGYPFNNISFETEGDGRIIRAHIETYTGDIVVIGVAGESGPFMYHQRSRLTVNVIPAVRPEEISDSERLSALLNNPSKLWNRNTDGVSFCGNGTDWRDTKREALDDLVRSLRVPESNLEAQAVNCAAMPEQEAQPS
jgi:hypothetical protein